jgi:hypothetical protein
MRRFLVILALAGSVLLTAFASLAISAEDPVLDLARYVPADADLFAAIRTDDAYFAGLDELLNAVLAQLPEPLKSDVDLPLNTRALLADADPYSPEWQILNNILGDRVGAAVLDANWVGSNNAMSESVMILIHLRPGTSEQALGLFEAPRRAGQAGPFTLYETTEPGVAQFGLSEDLLLVPLDMPFPQLVAGQMLADQPAFNDLVQALPESASDLYFYADPDYSAVDDTGIMAATDAGPFMMGGRLAGGDTGMIDIALAPGAMPYTNLVPYDEEFLRWVPADASLVYLATDIANNLEVGLQSLADVDPANARNLRLGLSVLGLDLERDIMPWAKGTYAAFATLDDALIAQATAPRRPGSPQAALTLDQFGFAFVVEANDPDAALDAASRLRSNLAILSSGEEAVSYRETTIAGTEVTIFTIDGGPQGTLEVAIGASDDIFFIGSPAILADYSAGMPDIRSSQAFQAAQDSSLADYSVLGYVDQRVLGALGAFAVADSLRWRLRDETSQVAQAALESVFAIPQAATLSGAMHGDFLRMRLTLSLNVADE